MKYYSEDDVMDLIIEAEDCERAYEWGKGHRHIHFEDYPYIEIPDKHGRLVDESIIIEKMQDAFINNFCKDEERIVYEKLVRAILDAPTVLEASTEEKEAT